MGAVRPFLTDFGIAKDLATGSKYTRSGQTIGTPDYMPPEQARGELEKLGPHSDVWSLGCVLFELLSGRPPFEGDSIVTVITGVLKREPVAVTQLRADVPSGVQRVIEACLAKAPADRYPGAGALRDDLQRVIQGRTPEARATRRAVVSARVAALAAVFVVVLLTAVFWPAPKPVEEPAAPAGPDPAALAERALRLRFEQPEAAARLLQSALAMDPGHPAWRLDLGLIRWAAGDNAGAQAAWRQVPPGLSAGRAALYMGLEAMFDLRGKEAVESLGRAARAPEPDVRALARAGVCVAAGRWPQARTELGNATGWEADLLRAYIETSPGGDLAAGVRAYTRALQSGVRLPVVYANRGWHRFELGDLDGALADTEQALRLRPRFPGALNNRGWFRLTQGRLPEAEADFRRALEIDPKAPHAAHNLATVLHQRGKEAEAERACDDLLARNAEDPQAHFTRGLARKAQRHWRPALDDLEAAVALAPNEPIYWHQLGYVRGRLDDLPGELAAYDRSLQLRPEAPTVLVDRGWARFRAGSLDGGEADCTAALRLAPDYVNALNTRGRIRNAQRRYDAALADFDRALAIDPQHGDARLGRLTTHVRLGHDAAVVADARSALRLGVGNAAAIRESLACSLYRLGRNDDVVAEARRSVAADPKRHRAWYALTQALWALQRWAECLDAANGWLDAAPVGHPERPAIEARAADCRKRLGQ